MPCGHMAFSKLKHTFQLAKPLSSRLPLCWHPLGLFFSIIKGNPSAPVVRPMICHLISSLANTTHRTPGEPSHEGQHNNQLSKIHVQGIIRRPAVEIYWGNQRNLLLEWDFLAPRLLKKMKSNGCWNPILHPQ